MKKYFIFKPVLTTESPDISNKIGEADDLEDAFSLLDSLNRDDEYTFEGLSGFVYDVTTAEFFGRNEHGTIQKLVISNKTITEIQKYFSAD